MNLLALPAQGFLLARRNRALLSLPVVPTAAGSVARRHALGGARRAVAGNAVGNHVIHRHMQSGDRCVTEDAAPLVDDVQDRPDYPTDPERRQYDGWTQSDTENIFHGGSSRTWYQGARPSDPALSTRDDVFGGRRVVSHLLAEC